MFPSRFFFPRRTDLYQLRTASIAVCAKKCNKNILLRLTSFMTSFSTSSSFLCSQRRSEVQINSKNLARCWLYLTWPLGISVYSNHTNANAALLSAQLSTRVVLLSNVWNRSPRFTRHLVKFSILHLTSFLITLGR